STLRAVALLLRAIRVSSAETPPCLSAEACLPAMTLLEPNLASESRLLRLSTLRVLARYDPLRFDDAQGGPASHRAGAQDECDFLEVAEALEGLPISVAAERDLMWRLGQLEVLGRSSRLPRPYAGLMATHALGLLRVKYSGVWPRAAAIVAALYQRPHQRDQVWGPMHAALRKVMPPPATRHQAVAPETVTESPWPLSGVLGSRSRFYGILRGRVPRFVVFNHVRAMQVVRTLPLAPSSLAPTSFSSQVWGVLSQCPELLQQHSRTVVPLFLGFVQYQYLGDKAFPDDPETRAVGVSSHLTPGEDPWGGERTADRRSVRARLVALLGVFASASGPKSLYKQRVLFRIYRALVVMPDEKVAGLALRCMLSYRPPYLVPY
ncbi:unnamed protein product, partial [Hapterophycus canaliculatus]